MPSRPGAPLLRRTGASAFQIVALDNPVHGRSNPDRRAIGVGSRRAGFGSLWRGARGFTRYRRPKGQLQLAFLPLDPHEITVLFAHSTVRAFVGLSQLLCPLLTSLPRSRGLRPAQSGMPNTTEISRGKLDCLRRTPAGSTTPALDGPGLRSDVPARPAG